MKGLLFPVLLEEGGLQEITVALDPKCAGWVIIDHPEFGVGVRLPFAMIHPSIIDQLRHG